MMTDNQGVYNSLPQGGNPTYTEAWALIEAARRLAESTQVEGKKEGKKAMQEALRLNWRLWTVFQAELAVAEETNVPEDIRINILTLCKFVDNHTTVQLATPEPERLMVLVDINRNIANGLLEGAKASEEAAKQAALEADEAQQSAPVAAPNPYAQAQAPVAPAAPVQPGQPLFDDEV